MAVCSGRGAAPRASTLLTLLLPLLLLRSGHAVDVCSMWPSDIASAEPSNECRSCLWERERVNATKVELYLPGTAAASQGNYSTLRVEHLRPGVCKLWAKYCSIRNITREALAALPCLRHALLGSNALEHLDPYTFANNSQLVQLSLKNNSVQLPPGPFLSSPSLRILDLSSCNINAVYNETFIAMPNLSVLLLRSNNIQTLHIKMFASLRRLEVLDVSKNAIERIEFVSKMSVRCFYAVQNPLQDILSTLTKFQLNVTLVFSKDVCCCSQDHCNHSASHWISKCEKCYGKYNSFSSTPLTASKSTHTELSSNVIDRFSSYDIQPTPRPVETTFAHYITAQTGVVSGMDPKQKQSANLAVILLSTIFSSLILLQSAFIVFLLVKAKRKETPNVYLEVTNSGIGAPPLLYGIKEQVTDLDAESCSHLSLNPVYETIPE